MESAKNVALAIWGSLETEERENFCRCTGWIESISKMRKFNNWYQVSIEDIFDEIEKLRWNWKLHNWLERNNNANNNEASKKNA